MAYIPDATVTSEPIGGRPAGTAAAEFRTLKQYLAGLLGFPSGLAFIQPNLLINPNWLIDQIAEGALYIVNSGAVQGPDGWTGGSAGTGIFKVRTLADPDNAALKCLEITCTTADAAIAAGDLYFLQTSVEGYDAAALMAGTVNAQQITVSFNFKSNVNGVYGISVKNSAANRTYVGIITVVDANEHTYTVTLTMDTAGVWLYNNGVGLTFAICLAGGATFQAVAGAWSAGNFYTTAAQCNFMSAITSIAYLKRIQLIRGGNVLPFQPADYEKELRKCQRYYEKTWAQGVAVGAISTPDSLVTIIQNIVLGTGIVGITFPFKVTKRDIPTWKVYSDATGTIDKLRDRGTPVDVAATYYSVGTWGAVAYANSPAAPVTLSAHFFANSRLS